ncbi:MAG: hypothetical protein AAFU73_10860 [Planctomycetota bacterium]
MPGATHPLASSDRFDNSIDGFDFAYCDLDAQTVSTRFEVSFYESIAPCISLVGIVPQATFVLQGLPAGGCWVVDIDLTGGNEFCIGADGGDGYYDDRLDLDSFGWSAIYAGTGTADAGIVLGADPAATDAAYINPNGPPLLDPSRAPLNPPAPPSTEGTGTFYNPLSGCVSAANPTGLAVETGSGLLSPDSFFVEDPSGASTGCTYFLGYFNVAGTCGASTAVGNNPYASFYMTMRSAEPCSIVPDCVCIPTSCPATPNTTGVPGRCDAAGSSALADNDFTLRASSLPPGVFGIFLHGETDISSNPISVGQGVLCIGDAGRFQAPNQIKQANALGVAELSTSSGEFSLSALPIGQAPFVVGATVGLPSYFAFWHRDFFTPSASAFNFTSTVLVGWY